MSGSNSTSRNDQGNSPLSTGNNAPAGSGSSTALFEELDDLLERMLSLPVFPDENGNATSPTPEVPLTPVSSSPPLPATAPLPPATATYEVPATTDPSAPPKEELPPPTPRVQPLSAAEVPPTSPEEPPAPPEPEDAPLSSQPSSEQITPRPSSEAYKGHGSIEAPSPSSRKPLLPKTASKEEHTETTEPEKPEFIFPSPRYPLWQLPMVWTTRWFDRLTERMGKTGEWLRHPTGRTCLGLIGITLLAVAGGIFFADWLGWTR